MLKGRREKNQKGSGKVGERKRERERERERGGEEKKGNFPKRPISPLLSPSLPPFPSIFPPPVFLFLFPPYTRARTHTHSDHHPRTLLLKHAAHRPTSCCSCKGRLLSKAFLHLPPDTYHLPPNMLLNGLYKY